MNPVLVYDITHTHSRLQLNDSSEIFGLTAFVVIQFNSIICVDMLCTRNTFKHNNNNNYYKSGFITKWGQSVLLRFRGYTILNHSKFSSFNVWVYPILCKCPIHSLNNTCMCVCVCVSVSVCVCMYPHHNWLDNNISAYFVCLSVFFLFVAREMWFSIFYQRRRAPDFSFVDTITVVYLECVSFCSSQNCSDVFL